MSPFQELVETWGFVVIVKHNGQGETVESLRVLLTGLSSGAAIDTPLPIVVVNYFYPLGGSIIIAAS